MMGKMLSKTMLMFGGEPAHYCPGCGHLHIIHVSRQNNVGAQWQWNGDADKPTFNPSVHIQGRCHYFLKDGMIEFLSDSTHKLAGQTVPLPEVPDWVK